MIYYIYGICLGIAMTAAVGQSIVRERGSKWLPLIVAVGIVVSIATGWGLEMTMHDLYGM
jgi:high-affinity Fe2+/Pb2+ permease